MDSLQESHEQELERVCGTPLYLYTKDDNGKKSQIGVLMPGEPLLYLHTKSGNGGKSQMGISNSIFEQILKLK